MRKALIAIVLAFVITLAVVFGNRMSTEAMAVVVGVVCGVAAGIPMSMLLLLVLNRRTQTLEEPPYGPMLGRQGAYPPVVVIQGGSTAPNGLMPPYHTAPWPAQEPVQRQFHIVGEDTD
jgi:hypothetical protein